MEEAYAVVEEVIDVVEDEAREEEDVIGMLIDGTQRWNPASRALEEGWSGRRRSWPCIVAVQKRLMKTLSQNLKWHLVGFDGVNGLNSPTWI